MIEIAFFIVQKACFNDSQRVNIDFIALNVRLMQRYLQRVNKYFYSPDCDFEAEVPTKGKYIFIALNLTLMQRLLQIVDIVFYCDCDLDAEVPTKSKYVHLLP